MKITKIVLSLIVATSLLAGCSKSDKPSTPDNQPERNTTDNTDNTPTTNDNQSTDDTQATDNNGSTVDTQATDDNQSTDDVPTTDDIQSSDDTQSVDDTQMVSVDFAEVSFEIPSTFQKLQEDSSSVLYLIDSNNGTSFNVIKEKLPPSLSLKKYMEISLGNAPELKVESSKYYKKNKFEWNETISTKAIENNMTLKLNQRTIVVNGSGYIFTYGSVLDYEEHLELYNDIVDSVVVK